ncbi:hypothetical protein BEI_1347 [Halomonas beimenensis]|uniref:Uncharacterized protein n=1 Tax=Halomonas beimenensis TaxID=475662 RepID=A0A291P617_9GAMM|nr:hypothetical protein BEI_1347 [Halomonas beimenensis]
MMFRPGQDNAPDDASRAPAPTAGRGHRTLQDADRRVG